MSILWARLALRISNLSFSIFPVTQEEQICDLDFRRDIYSTTIKQPEHPMFSKTLNGLAFVTSMASQFAHEGKKESF
jgi:hypothetical protein